VIWRAQGDDFRTFLNEFVLSVPQAELPIGNSRHLAGNNQLSGFGGFHN